MGATLADMPVGSRCIVSGNRHVGELRRRMLDMGLTRGTVVYIEGVAPMGDPIDLVIRGYNLALRRSDAEGIDVEPISCSHRQNRR